jgi:hypothetical protein
MPAEFQQLFEKIMKRADRDFMEVKPYGKMGDLKCDGLFFAKGTVFQVYSPDELTQAKLVRKIGEDLSGAAKAWGKSLKKWVFVYNARGGVPPDVARTLASKARKFRRIEISHMSNDELWEIARGLSPAKRAEVLGPPVDGSVAGTARGRTWSVIVHDPLVPISLDAPKEALAPDLVFGSPYLVRPTFRRPPWKKQAEMQRELIEEVLAKSRDIAPRFAVFSLAPIPLAVHLGFTLSDRVEVQCFQYDRDRKTWQWPKRPGTCDSTLTVTGVPDKPKRVKGDVVVRVSLSACVRPADTRRIVRRPTAEIDICCDAPDVMWLKTPRQLTALAKAFRGALAKTMRAFPLCRRIHLFYAGPTGGAIVIGQQVNPRMYPPVIVYQYSRHESPPYKQGVVLQEA